MINDIYSVKAHWSYLVIGFLGYSPPFLWMFSYLLKINFSVLRLRARKWRILFMYEILGFLLRQKFHVWNTQTLSFQFSLTITGRYTGYGISILASLGRRFSDQELQSQRKEEVERVGNSWNILNIFFELVGGLRAIPHTLICAWLNGPETWSVIKCQLIRLSHQ